MNKVILTIVFLMSTLAKGQTVPAEPIPVTPSSFGMSLVDYINLERFKNGLSELKYSDQLTCAASLQASHLAYLGLCTHMNARFGSFPQRASLCGGKANGEVIACGQKDFMKAVETWLDSLPHRAIIMDPKATEIGGAAIGGKWVVLVKK